MISQKMLTTVLAATLLLGASGALADTPVRSDPDQRQAIELTVYTRDLALVREVRYASCFSFKYSRRPGTPGAGMPRQVPEAVKSERLARLQALLAEHKREFDRAQVGRTLPVLLDKPGRRAGQLLGKSPYLQSVHVLTEDDRLGDIAMVTIEDAGPNSLRGRLAG